MSALRERLQNSKDLVFTVEFPVIDGGGMAAVEKNVARLSPWFVAANSTDNTAAHAHASNLSVAIAMKNFGLEPILQIVCRDKNRIAIQADMAGANLHGIENIALLTGDDVTAGDEPEARRVFDLDGPQAVNVASILNSGTYLSGRKLQPAPNFFISAVENPFTHPFDYRVQRAIKKHEAGAQMLQLQIGYHPDRLENFARGVHALAPDLALLPSVVLVKSSKPLNFMNDKVPGIDVPADVIARVASAEDQSEAAYQLALEQCKHALTLPGVRGIHVTDFRHDDTLERLMTDLGRTPHNL